MIGPKAIGEIHCGDESSLGSGAADMGEISDLIMLTERADDASMEGDFCGKVGQMEVT